MSRRKKGAVAWFAALVISAVVYRFVGVYVPPEAMAPPPTGVTAVELEKWYPIDGASIRVQRVIDGDTVELVQGSRSVVVRIIGIDTPETVHPRQPVQPGGPEASTRARELLAGQIVVVRYDPDRNRERWGTYGRLLAYLELTDGRDFGLVMIREGHAVAYTKYPFSREAIYVAAESAVLENP